MNWVTFIWALVLGACVTMALPHLFVAVKRRAWENLLFTITAFAVAGIAFGELTIMHSRTTEEIGRALQLTHVPVFFLSLGIVGFVGTYFGTGRRWLGIAAVGARLLALAINFAFPPNLNFREITALRHLDFLGETVAVPEGVRNPWTRLGELSSLLVLAFVIDASITLWRRGSRDGRRRSFVVGGSITLFIVLAAGVSALINAQIVHSPYLISFPFLGVILAMGFELSHDILRAAQTARQLRISEAALRESEERMSLATESANLGLWLWDIAHDEIWVTPRFRSMFGFGADESITFAVFRERLHPDDRETMERHVRAAIDERQPYELQYRLTLSEGGERWIAAAGRVEYTASGAASRMQGVCRDITEWRQAQQETERLQHEIAHVGRISMMGQLASALAHELNQPLGAILRNAEAAELFMKSETPDLEEIRAILADIRADDQRAGNVIDRMRALLKGHDLDTRMLDVAELVDSVADLTRSDAATRQVKLEVEVPVDLPPVRGDRVHLQQVLLNLILNGMDALNDAGLEDRRVMVCARVDGAQTVEIAVSDTGHGIAAGKLGNVFDPFFTTKPDGMGMGLPISRTIIEAHGGRLWAENNDGAGATFRFTLNTAKETATS
jgi:PAS domain S-box-containing protein